MCLFIFYKKGLLCFLFNTACLKAIVLLFLLFKHMFLNQ